MQALLSLLDQEHDRMVKALWQELEQLCGLKAAQLVHVPHFSWHGAMDYDCDALEQVLSRLAKEISPFSIQTQGLGIFSGEFPVLYIPIIKTSQLMDTHRRVWEETSGFAETGLNLNYAPQNWIPHITLAIQDTTPALLARAIELMGNRPFQWQIPIDNFAFLYCVHEDTATLKEVPLEGLESGNR